MRSTSTTISSTIMNIQQVKLGRQGPSVFLFQDRTITAWVFPRWMSLLSSKHSSTRETTHWPHEFIIHHHGGWRFVVVVARWFRSTKLTYAEPG